MFKVTTKHGTYYLIDFEKNRALRVRGPYSHEIIRDNVWFAFSSVFAFDRDAKEPEDRDKGDIQIGHSMYFNLRSFEKISWIISSEVVSIEEVEEDVYSGI